jgi:hypothetical protein
MVKVLIYSSKEIYEAAPYEGRAEAHIIAYRRDDDHTYEVLKNRTMYYMSRYHTTYESLDRDIRMIEMSEWEQEIKDHKSRLKEE